MEPLKTQHSETSRLKKRRGKKESRTKSTENMSYSYRILLGPDVTGKNQPTKLNTAPRFQITSPGHTSVSACTAPPEGQAKRSDFGEAKSHSQTRAQEPHIICWEPGEDWRQRFENNSEANSRKIMREKSSLHPVDHVRKSNAKNSRDIRVPTQQS